jgi:Ca2+-binding RTX toxin-like protein
MARPTSSRARARKTIFPASAATTPFSGATAPTGFDGGGGNDTISGGGGNDRISGRGGDDRIFGGGGKDTIGGGGGHDRLTGGAGADTFVFRSSAADNSDIVTDFKHGFDKLAFDHATFDTLDAGDLPMGAFFVGTEAGDADDRFIYDQQTGRLFYDEDGTGANAQVLVATLTNHEALTYEDILLL